MGRFFSKKDIREERSKRSLWGRIKDIALMDVEVMVKGLDTSSIEEIEQILLESDFGVGPTLRIVERLESEGAKGKLKNEEDYRNVFLQEINKVFEPVKSSTEIKLADTPPSVIMMTGVNGVGKTTSIAKLTHLFQSQGKKVLLGAGDTFRAGAIEQLGRWAERLGCDMVRQDPGSDPAAVAFDAVSAAKSRGVDILILDTAGRLHTQGGLMDELVKMKRVAGKPLEGSPHELLLVLDSTLGQNSVNQAKTFHKLLGVTGLVLAKFDGTSKAGCAIAITEQLGIPIKYVGTGEGIEDLETFSVDRYVNKIFSA